jgi:hypothetical protein
MVFDVVDGIPIAVSVKVEIFEYYVVGSQRALLQGRQGYQLRYQPQKPNAKTKLLRATVCITLP